MITADRKTYPCRERSLFMGNRRVFSMLLGLFLILSVFANSLMAEACFCRNACLHGLQDKKETSVSCIFHVRCSGTHCKSCSLEKGRTLKTVNCSSPSGNAKILNTTFTIFVLVDSSSTNYTVKGFGSRICACGTVPSPPPYLQNLSLLC
jgi:hypothetical protein